jgi:hypothetical protein
VYNATADGLYVLRQYPSKPFVPALFVAKCHEAIQATVNAIENTTYFGTGGVFESARADWAKFQKLYPDTDQVGIYLDSHADEKEPLLQLPLLELVHLVLLDDDEEGMDLAFVDADIAAAADNGVTGLEAAAAFAYENSVLDPDCERRLVELNPSLPTVVATHSVMFENRGRALERIPPRLPLPRNQHRPYAC